MRAEIISVGTELLLGDIVNTNAQYLAQQLASLGFSVYYQTVVGDNVNRLRSLVLEAKSRSDILVLTGGLGPTDDDLTKETVAEAFGDTLTLDADELVRLEMHFKRLGRPMPLHGRRQAMVPQRGTKLPNNNGTAPGAWFRQGNKYAVLLPGPPREMKPMFEESVKPLLQALQDAAIRSLTLRLFGVGESAVEELVQPLLMGENPTAALYAKSGEVHVRITAKAPTAAQADVMCEEYAAEFRAALGDVIYSEDGSDLETTVVRRLLEDGKTLATAESCTGGMLSERITSVPGSSGVFGYGAVTYANDAKNQMLGVHNATLRRYGAVSSQTAAEMAFGAAKMGGADYGVGITGIAGPGGGTAAKPVGLVYVAAAAGREVAVKKLVIPGRERDYVRTVASHHALDMVRRTALGLEIPDSKRYTKGQVADYERSGKPRRRGGVLGRALGALLLVAVVFVVLVLLMYYARGAKPAQPTLSDVSYPTAQGLRYGTAEYNDAACSLVESMAQQDTAVEGMIAFPGGTLEHLVARATENGQQQIAEAAGEAAVGANPVLAAGAQPAHNASNVVVLGGAAFEPLLEYAQGQNAKNLSTFTWYTARDVRVYQVFALYYDDGEEQDGFDPLAGDLSAYGSYMDFMLGAKVRSLCDVAVDVAQQDSFMTLAVDVPDTDTRRLYVCGRLARTDEKADTVAVAMAGTPLMPKAWYAEEGELQPNAGQLYAGWMRWYLARGTTNSQLQLAAGMPQNDTAPTLPARQLPASLTQPQQNPVEPPASSQADADEEQDPEEDGDAQPAADEGEEDDTQPQSGPGEDGEIDGGDEEQEAPSSSAPAVPAQPAPPAVVQPLPQKPDPNTLTVTMNGVVVSGPTDEILAQICQSDAVGLDKEAVKALAVATHSWILNRQGAGDEAPAVVGRPASAEVLQAVREVQAVVLSADGANPAFTPYFALAAFGTNTPNAVWGASRSYLAQVTAPLDQNQTGWRSITQVPAEDFAAAVQARLGINLEDYGAADSWITDIQRNDSGYVESLMLGGVQVSGCDMWQRILPAAAQNVLQSPAFEVEYNGSAFVFIGYGQGHGCGMSLAGAASYARQGWGYEQILEYYYDGTKTMLWD